MAAIDMSDAFDVFLPPAADPSSRTRAPADAGMDPSIESGAAGRACKSAEDIVKVEGLTVTMDQFSHACAASLYRWCR
jgi:hypothetical protein